MEQRALEITILSAKGLKDVGAFSKMDVYVAVSISGDPRTEQKTPVDTDGGSSPKWNFPMSFTVDEPAVQTNRLSLIFRLRHERKLVGDKDVGEVHVPVKELLDKAGDGKSAVNVDYPVRTPSGKAKGELKFSYKFGEVYKIAQAYVGAGASTGYPQTVRQVEPYMAPPPAGYPAGGSYGPPPGYPPVAAAAPGGYGYPPYGGYQPPPPGYPQQSGYGYPQQPGYGYPPTQQPQKSSGFGPGLGIGLVGGLVGGMVLGDIVSDAAGDSYDAGYDAGFDDGAGF